MGQGNIIGKPNLPATTSAKGVWNLREQNTANRAGSWPGYDPQWDKTTLLLKTAFPAADTVIDSSPNAFTVTRNGDTIQTTSTPYAPYWSTYFDGSTAVTFAANAAFSPGTGDFTVEGWINPTVWGSAWAMVHVAQNNGVYVGSIGSNFVIRAAGVTDVLTTATLPTLNAWTHVVAVRSGTTMSLFLNGVRVATMTSSYNFVGTGPLIIGSGSGGTTIGNISNVRFVKGTAVYDPAQTTLTVPTAPLTAVSGTSLLTVQNSRHRDNSTNNFAVTLTGVPPTTRFSPFAWTWSAASGGSAYFDGSGDSLSITSGTTTTLPSGNQAYTLEAWIFPTTNSGGIIGWGAYGSGGGVNAFRLVSNEAGVTNGILNYWWGSDLYSSSNCIITNRWQHVAATFDGTTRRLFVNGSLVGSDTPGARNLTTVNNLTIGTTNTSEFFTGHIANVRVLKGTAAYTANFAPPTSPVTAVSGTSLLLNFTNPAFFDTAVGQSLRQVGTAVARGTVAPNTNLTSTYFGGSGNYLTVADSPSLRMGTGNFTWEFWYYPTVFSGFYVTPIDKGYTATGALLFQSNGSDKMVIYASGAAVITSSTSFAVNTWYHLALVRNGTTLTLYVNGVSAGSATNTTDFNSTSQMVIGANSAGAATLGQYPITGFIANLRILNGTAAYTGTFTPPTAPHTQTANTALILNQTLDTWDATGRNALTNTGTVVATPSMFTGSALSLNGSQVARAYSGTLATDFAFGTSDFCIEAWIFPTSSSGDRNIFSTRGDQSVSVYFGLYTNAMTLGFYTAGTWIVVSTEAVPLNAWSHVALVRTGGVAYLYLNGRCVGSAANTTNLTGSSPSIGYDVGYNAYGWVGQLDEVRVTKAARYLGSFTPTTAPFDRDWEPPYNDTFVTSNVLQVKSIDLPGATNNVFRDDSTNNFTPVRYGDVTQGSFSPYVPSGYWSCHFDGAGDYIQAPSTTTLNFGTADFTVEAWINLNTTSGGQSIIAGTAGGCFGFRYGTVWSGGSPGLSIYKGSTADCENVTFPFVPGRWYHVAVSRQSGTVRFFVDGTQLTTAGSGYNGYNVPVENNVRIGTSDVANSEHFNGHISNVRVTKSALYTASFTPPTAPLTVGANTTLLACQDNRFISNGTTSLTFTRTGDVAVSRFDPFPLAVPVTTAPVTVTTQNVLVFDGNGDYARVNYTAAFDLSGSDWTMEAWFKANSFSTSMLLVSKDTYGSNYDWGINIASSTTINLYTAGTASVLTATVPAMSTGQWHHVAFVRQSGTNRIYLNGVQYATNTMGISNSSQSYVVIGCASWNNPNALFNGSLRSLRIVKGTAVYQNGTTFTPPATLTNITNTSLLVAGTLADGSSNNYTVTAFGDTRATTETTYDTTRQASALYGGSGYFDGSGDYLQIPASTAMTFGTGDFCVECYINLSATGSNDGVIVEMRNTGATSTGLVFNTRAVTNGYILNCYTDGAANLGATTLAYNVWHHVAVSRSGTTMRLFANGVVDATFTKANNFTDNPGVTIGQSNLYSPSNITGHLSNLRVVKGTAVYTANFTPPTSPVTAISGTSLLLNFDNAGVYDATGQRNLLTRGATATSTTSRKNEVTSLVFNNTDNTVVAPAGSVAPFVFGTGDFCIEFWVNRNSTAQEVLYDQRPLNTQGAYPTIYCEGATLYYYFNSANQINGGTLGSGAWNHIAVCRAASQTRMFVNGVQVGSTIADTTSYLCGAGRPLLGNGFRDGTTDYRINSYIEGLRVSRVGRYTANFSVPSEPFPIA